MSTGNWREEVGRERGEGGGRGVGGEGSTVRVEERSSGRRESATEGKPKKFKNENTNLTSDSKLMTKLTFPRSKLSINLCNTSRFNPPFFPSHQPTLSKG